jgi:hypothetical protein
LQKGERTERDGKKRTTVQCTICHEFEEIALKKTKNNSLPIAHGIFSHGKPRLVQIIDHVESAAHIAAKEAQALKESWNNRSVKHPWVNLELRNKEEVMKILIRMAFDVYNDCLLQRLSAYSWPSRSLTTFAADNFITYVGENGMDSTFVAYQPPPLDLHYRSPECYSEMAESIADCERQKLRHVFDDCIVFSLQVDGSVSRHMKDNKFVSCRFLTSENEMPSFFLNVDTSQSKGADGLLEVIKKTLNNYDAPIHKLVDITTDGESANARPKNELGGK